MYDTITLTHANHKTPVTVVARSIDFWWWSEASKATHVFCAGSNVFPALESPEQVEKQIKSLKEENVKPA